MESSRQISVAGRIPFSRTFLALRYRDYRLYWFALSVSLVGVAFQTVAQAWLVYRLTGSAVMLGLAGFIPAIVSAPASVLGGIIADRVSRRKLVVLTQTMMAIPPSGLALLIWLGQVQVWHVIAAMAALGIVAAIDLPSRTAMIPNLVATEHVLNAQGLASAVRQGAQIVGPAVAGLTIAIAGEAPCFLINGLTYLAMALAVALMRPQPATGATRSRGLGAAFGDGLRYTWRHPVILGLFGILAAQGLFLSPVVTLMPVYAKDVLQLGVTGMGWLTSAIGAGALVGALLVANIPEGRRGRILMIAAVILPFIAAIFALSRRVPLSVSALVLIGVGTVLLTAITSTMLLTIVPDEVRGRVNSLGVLVYLGAPYVAGLPAGYIAEKAGASVALVLGGVLFLLSLLVINLKVPALRRQV
jgi:MFS family permease